MRTKNSINNISMSLLTQLVMTCLGFISRKVFLDNLGINYLGINGLLTNVLSLLGLLEAGIGSSIVYNLYKPLAQNDIKKTTALMQVYKKAYTILALVVFIISIGLYPFLLPLMMKESSVTNISVVYAIFVIKNVISYLYSYKWCIINADQKNYILAKRNLIYSIVTTVIKIITLMLTKNYVLFLIIEVMIMAIQNIHNGMIVEKLYPYIKDRNRYKLDALTKDNIIKNVKALFLHNIGGYIVFGTDNLLISIFMNVKMVGIYSNYTMIINQITSLISPIINGIGNSVGNLIATEDNNKSYEIFKVSYLINFWIYSICVIFLYNLLNPFIKWWIGEEYLLDSFTFLVILFNLYINGMRSTVIIFKNKAGIFIADKYAPLIEGIINLVSSIILVNYFGLAGIFLGTTVSTLSIVFWNAPRLLYKYLFNKPLIEYLKAYFYYAILTLITCYITTIVCNYVNVNNQFLSLILKGIICLIVPNITYLLIFYRGKEVQYLSQVFKINCSYKVLMKRNFGK